MPCYMSSHGRHLHFCAQPVHPCLSSLAWRHMQPNGAQWIMGELSLTTGRVWVRFAGLRHTRGIVLSYFLAPAGSCPCRYTSLNRPLTNMLIIVDPDRARRALLLQMCVPCCTLLTTHQPNLQYKGAISEVLALDQYPKST